MNIDIEAVRRAVDPTSSGKKPAVRCPAHDDSKASCSINESEHGELLVHCHAGCPQAEVFAAVRAKAAHLLNGTRQRSEWIYRDESSNPLRRAVRVDPGKTIWQEHHANGDGWRKGINGAPCSLLWLDELAKTDQLVVVVEGEPAAEAARKMFAGKAFVTTWPGGAAAAAKADITPLKGRKVVLWPDNDEPGREAMQTLRKRLVELGVFARVFEPWSDMPDKSDAVDAVDLGYGAQHFFERLGQHTENDGGLRVIDLGALQRPIEPVSWIWEQRIPRCEVTLLSGHGGAGKSMLALILALQAWSGSPAWGVPTERSRVAFFSAEDDPRTLLRRTKFICSVLGKSDPEPDSGFFLIDATTNPELFITPRSSNGFQSLTAVYNHLREFMSKNRIDLVMVDNASDAYAGDEIKRAEVRAFIRSLVALAREFNAAIVLLAHVDKLTAKGSKDSQSYSGSTAWHNSVRSRLYLSQSATRRLALEHQKSNHGALAPTLHLSWQESDVPRLASPDEIETPAANEDKSIVVIEPVQMRRVLQSIDEFTRRGEYVATAYNSSRSAASLFRDTLGKKFPIKETVREAHRASYLEEIEYRGENRHTTKRWEVSTSGRQFAGLQGAST